MNCDSVTRDIALYFYGELTPEEEERIEAHLDGCPACRREMERQRAMAAALERREIQPSAALLAECRHDLMRAVYRDEAPARRTADASAWALFREGFEALFASLSRLRQPAGAVALVALGYFSSRLPVFGPATSNSSFAGPEFEISTVRSVQPDASGRVQIALDETRRRVISGRPDDGNIRRLLLTAARDESNPGVRVETMDILKNHPASAEIRSALLNAAARDPNAGVRLKALEGLRPFAADAEVRRTLSQVLLNDENPGVRIQAIDMLIAHRDESMVGVLQNLVEKENNSYVRQKCVKTLKEMNASVGTF